MKKRVREVTSAAVRGLMTKSNMPRHIANTAQMPAAMANNATPGISIKTRRRGGGLVFLRRFEFFNSTKTCRAISPFTHVLAAA